MRKFCTLTIEMADRIFDATGYYRNAPARVSSKPSVVDIPNTPAVIDMQLTQV